MFGKGTLGTVDPVVDFPITDMDVVGCHVQTCAVDGVTLLCGDGNRIPNFGLCVY